MTAVPATMRLRLARRLAEAWSARATPGGIGDDWPQLVDAWERVAATHRRVTLARSRRLDSVLPHCLESFRRALRSLGRLAGPEGRLVEPPSPPGPDLAAWAGELQQLEDEFDGFEHDAKAKTLTVVTEPVELDDVDLGPFAIVCRWSDASEIRRFEVVARRPCHPPGRDDVTHPHVQDDCLCLGDAAKPLAAAFAAGRLADCFVMIRSVLQNYNPDSAYVALERWTGVDCCDCGRVVDHDDRCSCDRCGDDLCDSCLGSCSVCSDARCSNCLQECPSCDESACPACFRSSATGRRVCSGCLAPCADCGRSFAKDERSEDDLCTVCAERCAEEPIPETADGEVPAEEEPACVPLTLPA